MLLPWWPVVWVDVVGAALALGLGFYCVFLSWRWTQKRPDDPFRHYVFLLTIAIGAFTISRSVDHIAKQVLLLEGMAATWYHLAPFSGAVNTITFVMIFAFSIYFDHLRQIKLQADKAAIHLAATSAKAAAAEEAEIRLRAIFDGFADVIYVVDRDHRILLSNSKVERLNPDVDAGRACYASLHNRREPCQECRLEEVLQGKAFNFEKTLPDMNMTAQIIETPLVWPDGQTVKLTVLRDITEKKSLEAQFLHAQKMEAVGVLAGGIAHDFNNLLTIISGFAEILLRELGPSREEAVGIKKAAQRAAGLTRQLLLFSRKKVLTPKVMDLRILISNLEKMLTRLIGENIELVVESAPAALPVKVDPSQIEQVIMNLVVNAHDALPAGGRITLQSQEVTLDEHYCQTLLHARPGKFVRLTVSDNGEGMNKEVVARVFEPFFTTKEQHKGTGLGLSVVYGIIEQHGGWINVYSEPGQGTTFRLYLPAAESAAGGEEQESVPLPAGRGERILLVEDEKDVRQVTGRILVTNGYRVVETASVEEALGIFDREGGRFDLVLSDIVLPDGSGFQVFTELRARNPHLPFLLASGYADEKSQWPLILEKKIPFLQKPFNMTELARATAAAINGQRQGGAPAD